MVQNTSDKVEVYPGYYIINGEKFSRMTSVVDVKGTPGLDAWRERVGKEEADRIAKETSEFGQMVHTVTALWDLKEYKKFDSMMEENLWLVPFWCAWDEWTKEFVKQWIAVERVVWSPQLGIAGQLDRAAFLVFDRSPYILDIKTKKALNKSVENQMGGYAVLYNEGRRSGLVKNIAAVHMPRTNPGNLRIKHYDLKEGIKGFRDNYRDFANIHFS